MTSTDAAGNTSEPSSPLTVVADATKPPIRKRPGPQPNRASRRCGVLLHHRDRRQVQRSRSEARRASASTATSSAVSHTFWLANGTYPTVLTVATPTGTPTPIKPHSRGQHQAAGPDPLPHHRTQLPHDLLRRHSHPTQPRQAHLPAYDPIAFNRSRQRKTTSPPPCPTAPTSRHCHSHRTSQGGAPAPHCPPSRSTPWHQLWRPPPTHTSCGRAWSSC